MPQRQRLEASTDSAVRRALWTRRTPAHSSLTRRPVGGCGVRKGPVRAGRTPHRCTRCATRAIVRAWRASARSQGRTLPSTLCSSRRVPSDSARARVRACVLPVGCNQSRRAVVRTRVLTMRSACTCTHTCHDGRHMAMRMAHKPTTRNILPFRCTSMLPRRLSRVASSSRRSHHGSSPPQARAVAALPQPIRCVCGPHWLASAPHVARCMLRVACCVLHGVRRCTCAHGQARG